MFHTEGCPLKTHIEKTISLYWIKLFMLDHL